MNKPFKHSKVFITHAWTNLYIVVIDVSRLCEELY